MVSKLRPASSFLAEVTSESGRLGWPPGAELVSGGQPRHPGEMEVVVTTRIPRVVVRGRSMVAKSEGTRAHEDTHSGRVRQFQAVCAPEYTSLHPRHTWGTRGPEFESRRPD
jgi:hypothetical protein